MAGEWFDRIRIAIERDGRDLKEISLKAKCGQNYVQQMLKDRKEPGIDRFLRILNVLGSASALYVITGVDVDPEDEQFFRLAAQLDPELKAEAYRFFALLQARSGTLKPPNDPQN